MTEPLPGAGPVDSLRPGTQIREWRIERFLASGGFGQVFEARRASWVDTEPSRALKVFDPIVSSAARSSLISEFSVLRRVHHPHLISGEDAFDVAEGPLAGCVVFVMERADTDLASEINRRGPLPLGEALDVGAQVAEGLDALHAGGQLHGDVKPANILRVGDIWKLGDFGVSVTLQGSYALVQATTLDYRPPELSRGEQGARSHRSSDVWAMGVTLWIAATGQHPFVGSDPHLRYAATLRDDRRPAPHLHPTVADYITTRCLNMNPRARATAAELAVELRSLAAYVATSVPVPSPPGQPASGPPPPASPAPAAPATTAPHPGPTLPSAPAPAPAAAAPSAAAAAPVAASQAPAGWPLVPPPARGASAPAARRTTASAGTPRVVAALAGVAVAAAVAEGSSLGAAALGGSLAVRRTVYLVAVVGLLAGAALVSRPRMPAALWRVALTAALLTAAVATLILFGTVG